MTPDLDAEGLDEEAADPPLVWLGTAVAAIGLVAAGLVATVLGVVGLDAPVVAAVPALSVLFDLSVVVLVLGLGLFVLAMTEWDPDVSP